MILKKNDDSTFSVYDENITTKIFSSNGAIDVPTHLFTGTSENAQNLLNLYTQELNSAKEKIDKYQKIVDIISSNP